MQQLAPELPPEGWVGICRLAKEEVVAVAHELSCLLLLSQTLPSILRGKRACLSATSKVLQEAGPASSGSYWNSRPDSLSCSSTWSPGSGPELPPPPRTLEMWLMTKRRYESRLWLHQLWKQIMGIF